MAQEPRKVDPAGEIAQELPLLTTKLYAPQARPGPVPRPRLTGRLNEGLSRRLTLISAPAGFGKTTLISEWRSAPPASELPFAWVSLDADDNEPARFWTYVVAGLGRVQSDLGAGVLPMLRAPQPPPIRSVLTALINEIAALPHDFVLVLDDYHTIQAEAIHDALAFLLDHAPQQQHLVLASRTDPPLPLYHLRGRGQLVELHQRDLRFTAEEATAFLNQVMGMDLSAQQVAALDARTEGWIAGLQMAALSLRGREDTDRFITAFSGGHRYVVEYLVGEVLGRQSERVQEFLLRTSVLHRMCGPLCDALTGQGDGRTTLQWMETANLFTIPLDDERRWYRYHHLFADVLRGRLQEAQPKQVPKLHRLASEWYAENELLEEAVSHALAAQDLERAADLIEGSAQTMWDRKELATLRAWLEALPEDLVRSRPRLCILRARTTLYSSGDYDAVEGRLRDAERLLSAQAEVAGDDAQARAEVCHTLGQVAALRVDIAGRRADVPRAVELSRQALDLLPEDDDFWRAAVVVRVSTAHLFSGDALAAERVLLEVAKNVDVVRFAAGSWGLVLQQRGHLRRAAETYRQGLRVTGEKKARNLSIAKEHRLMAQILYEWNDLGAAMHHLPKGTEIARQWDDAVTLAWCYLLLAWVYRAQGEVERAADTLEKAMQLLPRLPDLSWISSGSVRAVQARHWLAEGDLGAAVRWAQSLGLSLDDDFRHSYFGMIDTLTLARVRIAQARARAGKGYLERVLRFLTQQAEQAETHGRMWDLIQILVLQALARQVQGDIEGALAEPEGYVRTFIDEGQPMAELLRLAAARGIAPGYVAKLLAAYGEEPTPTAPPTPAAQPLLEPLSERELEVLQLLAEGLTNREIAQALSVTVGTAKTHVNHIYGKLDVHSRVQAVSRARELGLLARV